DPKYYKHSPEKNPQGTATGTLKSVRSTYHVAGGLDLKIGGSVTRFLLILHRHLKQELKIKNLKDFV
ncbi:hypothetical protein ACW7EJ_13170, partial [Acinetobacter soli]